MLFRVMIVLLAMTGFARAQAVWVDYAWSVEPAKENRFFAAVDKFVQSDTFKSFEGRMLVNAHAANGPAPQNFSFAVVYKDLATWEATQANLNGTADWDRFRKALAANGTLTGETVYTHVAGWGEINNERGGSWEGAAAAVSDQQNYVARLTRLMNSSIMQDMPGSLDVWRVTAGGTPGVSHIVVFGDDSWSSLENYRTEAAKNPDFRAAIAGMAKVRTLLGAIWTTTIASYGPLDLNSVR
jgi:hypothetical protein